MNYYFNLFDVKKAIKWFSETIKTVIIFNTKTNKIQLTEFENESRMESNGRPIFKVCVMNSV